MKKIIALALITFVSIQISAAQEKVTKQNILGKWKATHLEIPGTLEYYIDKDSVKLGDAILSQLGASGVTEADMIAQMKEGLKVFNGFSLLFNADGSNEVTMPPKETEKSKYSLDEAKSNLTLENKSGEKQELNVSMKEGNMKINFGDAGGGLIVTLKKEK